MKRRSVFAAVFSVIMLVCVLFLLWYVPSVSNRSLVLDDIRKQLETSRGRERKQQYEYDETVAAIPEAEAELERILPLSEAAQKEVKELKKERKKLRNEKKALQGTDYSENREVTEHE